MNKPVIQPLESAHTQSANLREGNLAQLKALFPEAFKEGGIDFEVLKQLLGGQIDEREEKYGLNWHGKRRARQIALTPSAGTLRPCPQDSVEWDTTQNLMIEGDNLEVLKLLQKSYAGKVKMIYIDPPYNTGKDFVYPDNFTDNIKNYLELTGQTDGQGRKLSSNTESSGRFHTDWLNMMYPRLKLARNLLREDGVIFISIDDSEVSNLRKICDDIFGEENFIANVVWQKKYAPQNDATYFSDMHDHILVYSRAAKTTKNDEFGWSLDLLPRTASQNEAYKNPDADLRGVWQSDNLSVKTYSAKNDYEITTPSGRVVRPPESRSWIVSSDRYEELLADNRIWFGADGQGVPRQKRFLSEVQDGTVPVTWWTYQECGHNQDATKELKDLFAEAESDAIFDTPKPVQLITRMLQLATKSDPSAIVLDFFAGSGTTGQAVYEMNLATDGDRRFILVQLPEPIEGKSITIAELTKERLRRAAIKIRASCADSMPASGQLSLENEPEKPQKPLDLGFKVFKLDTSNIRAWNPNPDELEGTLMAQTEHLASGRSEGDVLYEILLKQGLDLALPLQKKQIAGHAVHSVGAGALLVCLARGAQGQGDTSTGSVRTQASSVRAENVMAESSVTAANAEALALGMADWHAELAAALGQTPAELSTRVVLRDSLFDGDVAKTNLTAILRQRGLDDVRSL